MLQQNSAITAATAVIISPICSELLCKKQQWCYRIWEITDTEYDNTSNLKDWVFFPPHKYFSNSEVWELGEDTE